MAALKFLRRSFVALAALYFLLLIPAPEPAAPAGANRTPFAWNRDAFWSSLETQLREARALGIHWAFAPVVDVNNNPENPVINIRSYGEDAELVSRTSKLFPLFSSILGTSKRRLNEERKRR